MNLDKIFTNYLFKDDYFILKKNDKPNNKKINIYTIWSIKNIKNITEINIERFCPKHQDFFK